ncbi:MAG: type I restriction enzyme HsdR N-terminal domain-containing protein [Bacteroidales bacterium]|nr:type I restriction enzyme HsdR N-terminal domain-containing protein [Bacteroidales bacterium]MBN2756827.1 type I restriction enzyme HsdR N-terminal domain-containing protein [Bacteroidales bacterium]
MIATNFYKDFDFQLLNSEEFKEDAVREELINPILKSLGYKAYGHNKIIYSKTLAHPFVKIGSKKRQINIVPDYLFEINGKYSWVLDAKAPNENILSGDHIEQVYSYAIHPDIHADIFALCNGKEFAAFKKNEKEPLLFFQLSEIDQHWDEIQKLLSPDIFVSQQIVSESQAVYNKKENKDFDYLNLKNLPEIPVKKQAAKRHFGVHGYFTKQSWNIVQDYISHYSKVGDTVLDPFGGSGVTAIEALMTKRKAIHIDLNPLSVFIASSLIAPVDFNLLADEFDNLEKKFTKSLPQTDDEIKKALEKYPYPKGNILPKGSDVETVEDLFSEKQLAQLAFLKHLILKVKDDNCRNSFLLSFSSTINKINQTFHYTESKGGGGGDSAPFRYYRYRIAHSPADLDVFMVFSQKLDKLRKAKQEIAPLINKNTIDNAQIIKGTATDLSQIQTESIDYIYTDPPYGAKIPYLDLSTMWNAWLDLDVSDEDRKLEAIEGGMQNKTKDEYVDLLSQSINEMYRVLKYDRWMSFVFAHKDPHYWHAIVDTAEKAGFEYAGTVKQANGQTSFKKRQNPFSVLAGQLIINFIKKETPKAIQRVNLGNDIYDLVLETIEAVIAQNEGATLEQINDELIMKGMELGFLHVLSKEYKDLTPILMSEYDYDQENQKFHIRKNMKFKTKIPLDMRIKYFLLSYMKRKETIGEKPTTDDIILDIMPLLRNGITPENQTILIVLRTIAEEIDDNKWRLKQDGQLKMNF